MNSFSNFWQRLTAAARMAVDERDVSAPYGFSTRIAALAMAAERPMVAVFGRFSLRALAVAAVLMIVSVAANLDAILNAVEDATPVTDITTELADVS